MVPSIFAPDLGRHSNRLWEVIAAVKRSELHLALDEILNAENISSAGLDDARLQFCASLLADILRAGGAVWVRDSRLLVSWPDWEGNEGRRNAQVAMAAAGEMRPVQAAELTGALPMAAAGLD